MMKERGSVLYPIDSHYFMPAEWAPHQRTFVAWPVQESMCYPENYEDICRGYGEIVHAVSEFEPVSVFVNPEDVKPVSALFENKNIEVLPIEHNDSWIRDSGPTFLTDLQGHTAGINWKFNAWGEKYAPWDLDDKLARRILEQYGVPCFDAPLVMEGGSIHVDGEGTLITTRQCLLNPNRNSGLSKEQIEEYLKKYLGVKKIIWLENGLAGDETDGHVDNLACFAAPGKILLQTCSDINDENYEISQRNLALLKSEKDAKGRTLEVIPIEQPPAAEYKGQRLTLSYLNFYLVNSGVILPVFGGAAKRTDEIAEEILHSAFPSRRIRKINGMGIIKEGGNVHCATQQMVLSSSKGTETGGTCNAKN